jgi:hypothetical protein
MPRILPGRALLAAPILTLLFAMPAAADPHRGQIQVESFSWSVSQSGAFSGTGKTMAAQVLASDLR